MHIDIFGPIGIILDINNLIIILLVIVMLVEYISIAINDHILFSAKFYKTITILHRVNIFVLFFSFIGESIWFNYIGWLISV